MPTRIPLTQILLALYIAASWAPGLLDVNGDISASFVLVPLILVSIFLPAVLNNEGTSNSASFQARWNWSGDLAIKLIIFSSLGIMVLSAISALHVDAPFRVFRTVYGYSAGLIAMYAITVRIKSIDRLNYMIKLSVACAVMSSLVAAAGYWIPSLRTILFEDADRTAALFKHQNQFGMALSATAPFALGLIFQRKRRALSALALCITLLGIILSGSKTNMILFAFSVVIGSFCFSLLLSGWSKLTFSIILPAGIAIASPFALYILEYLNPRALTLLTTAAEGNIGDVQSFSSRLNLWDYSIEAGVNNFWLGEGVGSSVLSYNHSHNVVLDYFRTLGGPGLFCVTILIISSLWFAIENIRIAVRKSQAELTPRISLMAASISLVSYVAANMLSDSFGPWTIFIFWIAIGFSIVSRRSLSQPNSSC